jgi:hypothetical protein
LSEKPNLKEIQKKAYTSYHQDGLLDIFASAYILTFATGILMDFLWDFSFGVILPGFLLALILPMWIAAKRRITIPRIGFVKFGRQGSEKVTATLTGLTALGVAILFLFALFHAGSAQWLNVIIENGMIAIGFGALAVCLVFGYAMGLKRLYAYGIIALTFFVVGHIIGIFFAYVVIALGITVAATGVNLLVNFVRKYPLKGEKAIVA